MTLPPWITIIATIITTFTTIALAIITWCYVRLTKEYVSITKDILKATNKPEVIVYLYDKGTVQPDAPVQDILERTIVYLCIHNIGTGYASDIWFSGDLSFQPTLSNDPLAEMEPFKNGYSHLGAGYKIDIPLFLTGQMTKLPEQSFNILVSYKDSTKTPREENFPFEVGNWENNRQFISPIKD